MSGMLPGIKSDFAYNKQNGPTTADINPFHALKTVGNSAAHTVSTIFNGAPNDPYQAPSAGPTLMAQNSIYEDQKKRRASIYGDQQGKSILGG